MAISLVLSDKSGGRKSGGRAIVALLSGGCQVGAVGAPIRVSTSDLIDERESWGIQWVWELVEVACCVGPRRRCGRAHIGPEVRQR